MNELIIQKILIMSQLENLNPLLQIVKEVILKAKSLAYRSSNAIMLNMYWEIGQLIVEDEQQGNAKATYGKATLKSLSKSLTLEFGSGFDDSNLRNMRQFFLAFPIRDAVRHELSWTHYRMISRVKNDAQRVQYINLSIEGNWDTRTLQRNIATQYVGRILAPETNSTLQPKNIIKDPYILEFYGLPADIKLTEKKLETALINHIQQFLMELGKGFAFVARQQHIVTDTSDFYIDLVFYNYYLKCFVLIDLKTDKLSHADIGQMDMYVRMYDDLKKSTDDNPTIGIILCTEKDDTIVKYSVLAENEHLFASKYRLYLPKEEELKQLIEQDRVIFDLDGLDGE
jgi:predicted nuclease of restriction endonuclease-like (RecB) superfamily